MGLRRLSQDSINIERLNYLLKKQHRLELPQVICNVKGTYDSKGIHLLDLIMEDQSSQFCVIPRDFYLEVIQATSAKREATGLSVRLSLIQPPCTVGSVWVALSGLILCPE
jgi:hypothetical protein